MTGLDDLACEARVARELAAEDRSLANRQLVLALALEQDFVLDFLNVRPVGERPDYLEEFCLAVGALEGRNELPVVNVAGHLFLLVSGLQMQVYAGASCCQEEPHRQWLSRRLRKFVAYS